MLGRAGLSAYPRFMDTRPPFDPEAPLPGPPEPWASTDMPSPRGAPPFHMTEMIAAEPAIVQRILTAGAAPDSSAAVLARAVAATIAAGSPVAVTGCGTSEHAALAVVEILREATGSHLITSAQAFELAQEPPSRGLVIGISHEGATGATNAALVAARDAGCQTALITVSRRSPGAALADILVETHELDQSWCHTVGYTSPIAVGAAVTGHLTGTPLEGSLGRQVTASLPSGERSEAATAIAQAVVGVDRILVLGSGADRVAGRELVLKIEEGAWLAAAYRDLETFLHGHLAATDDRTAVIVIATDRRGRDARMARVSGALAAARVIGMPTGAIVTHEASARLATELTSTGRIVLDEAPDEVPSAVASLLGSAMALQHLTEQIAIARGIDPDPIHRDVERYRQAADAAG
jgi:glucosamine--fructose-6-phosphate aminotransferase (isomerizing)